MDFLIESLLLILATLGFYAVFASLINYWKETPLTVLVVPLMYTFHFFFYGFVVVVVFKVFQYALPIIISLTYG